VQLIDDRVLVPKRIDSRITQPLRHAANLCRTNPRRAITGFNIRGARSRTLWFPERDKRVGAAVNSTLSFSTPTQIRHFCETKLT